MESEREWNWSSIISTLQILDNIPHIICHNKTRFTVTSLADWCSMNYFHTLNFEGAIRVCILEVTLEVVFQYWYGSLHT